MIELLKSAIGPIAKAVAAFVTPLVAALVAYIVERTGVEVPYDPSAVEALVTSVVTSALVWLIANSNRTAKRSSGSWS